MAATLPVYKLHIHSPRLTTVICEEMNSLHYDTTHPLTVLTGFTTHLPSDYIPIYYPHIYIYLPTHLTYCLHYPPTYQRTAFTSYLPTTVTYPHIYTD